MPILKRLRGNVNYLLFALIFLHFTYPFSELSAFASLFYLTMYCLMLVFGLYLTAIDRRRLISGTVLTATTIGTGVLWVATSNDLHLNIYLFIFYFVIILNNMLISWTILEFIFTSQQVTQAVLSAGITFYLMLGNVFTPLYLLLNSLVRITTGADAFALNVQSVDITWQRMYYFSFTTLTTLGYGDITPVSPYVEPFVTAQATIGVLYLAVLMARLVSLYERRDT